MDKVAEVTNKSLTVEIEPRIAVKKNTVFGIQNYDSDNAYPQNIEELIASSGTATSCTEKLATFIKGEGLKDPNFYKAKINRKGNTVDQLQSLVANDGSTFNGFAIHVNFNLNGKCVEANIIPWPHVRFTWEDEQGCFKVAVYDDWNRVKRNTINRKKIDYFDLYNPALAVQSMIELGAANYKGQVYLYTNRPNTYPLSTIDAVREDVVTDAEIKLFKSRNITTNFMASHVFTFVGVTEEKQQLKKVEELKRFQGAKKGGKIFVNFLAKKEEAPIIDPVVTNNMDKAYQYTEESTQDNIRQRFNIPSILIGKETAGKLGGSAEVINAIKMYNAHTKNWRMVVEQAFKEIFSNWETPICPSNDYSTIPVGTGEFASESINTPAA